jgi:hypothetical protein
VPVGAVDVASAVRPAQVVAGLGPALTIACTGPVTAFAAGSVADPPPPCLIVNPRSFRASRGLAGRAGAVAAAAGAEVVRVEGGADVTAALERILARRQRHVAVLAGDGTVREIVETLARMPSGTWLPELLLLPGGRSNLTAADLVPRRDPLGTLARALQSARDGSWDAALAQRRPLCVLQSPAPPRVGFFFGGAWIDSIVRRAEEHRNGGSGPLRTGHLSSPWLVTQLAARGLVGRSGVPTPELEIEAEDLGRLRGKVRLLLATTLEHESGAFDPYADRGQGPLRITAVAAAVPRFWSAFARLLTGRYSAAMTADQGYLSGRCERIRIAGLAGYVLDGERFDTDPARPVEIVAGPPLRLYQRR